MDWELYRWIFSGMTTLLMNSIMPCGSIRILNLRDTTRHLPCTTRKITSGRSAKHLIYSNALRITTMLCNWRAITITISNDTILRNIGTIRGTMPDYAMHGSVTCWVICMIEAMNHNALLSFIARH